MERIGKKFLNLLGLKIKNQCLITLHAILNILKRTLMTIMLILSQFLMLIADIKEVRKLHKVADKAARFQILYQLVGIWTKHSEKLTRAMRVVRKKENIFHSSDSKQKQKRCLWFLTLSDKDTVFRVWSHISFYFLKFS